MKRVLVAVVLACVAGPAGAAPLDFTAETRTVYAVAACGEAAPSQYDASTVAAHCKALATKVAQWKTNWLAIASPWFRRVLDKGYPSKVVYPFGGGDMITMLAVYPDA